MIETYNRKSVFSELGEYCILAGEHDYIEVTEWKNGEGIDVNISAKSKDLNFALTWGELKALKKLAKKIEKH